MSWRFPGRNDSAFDGDAALADARRGSRGGIADAATA
jgi:hypothetical protein